MLFYYSKTTLLRGAGGAGWTYFSDFGVIFGGEKAIGSLMAAGGCHWNLWAGKCEAEGGEGGSRS